MKDYTKKVIEAFPEEITITASTPTGDYLFKIQDDSETKKLSEDQPVTFYHTIVP